MADKPMAPAVAQPPARDEVLEVARKYALQNAVQHGGSCQVGPVMSRLLAERSDWRPHARSLSPAVKEAVDWANGLGAGAQLEALEAIDPALAVREVKERAHGLPDLPGAEGGVVMRFAPGPSGPLHIGHSRAAILNDEYVRRYGGRYILRFEDTDPARIAPEAYAMIREDMDWLRCRITDVYEQTDRFDHYYSHASKLLAMGAGYVCTCPPETWRGLKEASRPCPHREEAPETQLLRWEGMLAGAFPQEGAVVVIKTELGDPNPALRDWVALRITDEPHPKTGTKYRVYPLYNYSVAIDDHLMGMTHVLRGKDHLNNTMRQKWVYSYMGWKEPYFHHYGNVSIEDAVLKKSVIREAVMRGEYSGWDDPRVGTLRALARRGLDPEAIRRYWVEASIRPIEIGFSWKTLFAHDRDIHEPSAPRLFFVADPVVVTLEAPRPLEARAPVHPDRPDMGVRELRLPPSAREGTYAALLCAADMETVQAAGRFRLKDLGNFELVSSHAARYIGNDLAVLKEGVPIVHWVPPGGPGCVVHHPDGHADAGVAEVAALDRHGQFVQFERYGYVRIEVDREKRELEGFFAYR